MVSLILAAGLSAALAAEPAGPTSQVSSKVPVEVYGYVKLDMAYDDSRVDVGNFARWVESEDPREDDDQLNITARQTRLGINISGQEFEGMKPSGKLEFDFYGDGAGGAENKPMLMLRHAYVKLDWAEYDFSIIGGQTSDVVSPLVPSTLNYTVFWWQGNPGYRRPQLRLTKGFGDLGETLERVEVQLALTRNIGHDGPFDPGDTGEDAGVPGLQWRVGGTLNMLTDKPTVVGVSGSWHTEEYDTTNDDDGEDYDSYMINVDVTAPLADWLTLKGEFFTGENLDTFLAGIGQGINVVTAEELESMGGWVAATIKPVAAPYNRWTFTVGGGMEEVDDAELAVGAREKNMAIFGNAVYDLGSGASAGLEIMHLSTDYAGDVEDGDAVRVQLSLIYKF